MMSTTVAVDVPQHMKALARANEIRLARARIKREVARFERDICEVIANPPEAALTMSAGELITSLRGFGNFRMEGIVRTACRSTLKLEHMGPATKAKLCDRIDEALGRVPQLRDYR